MINVYDSRETDFNNNGLVVLNECISCTITDELNKGYSLELEYPKDARGKYLSLQGWNIIKANGQLFRIPIQMNIQDKGISVKVTANHIFYDLSNDYNIDSRAENKSVQEALQIVTAINPKFTIGQCDDLGANTAYFVGESPTTSIYNKILTRWGGELYRDNFTVAIKNRIGADNGILVAYGKNIQGFEQTLDYSNLATKIKPVGKDGLVIDLVNEGSSWLESPRINEYFMPFVKEVKFDNIEDATELKNAAEALWGTIDLPICNYSVKFADLSKTKEYEQFRDLLKLNLGDTITIKHKVFSCNISARVIKIVRNILTDTIDELELGQFKSNIMDKVTYNEQNIQETKTDLAATKTTVKQTQDEISLQATKIDNNTNDIANLSVKADNISATVSNNTTDISNLTIRADSIESTVSKKIDEGECKSVISQSASEIRNAINNQYYSFTENSFQIGNTSNTGDIAEHTPTYSKWKKSDGTYTQVDSTGICNVSEDGNTKLPHFYLFDAYTITISGDESGFKCATVNTPTKFIGKQYKVIPGIQYVGTSGNPIINFGAYLNSVDYTNNTITFSSYVNTSNGTGSWTVNIIYFLIA